MFFFWLSLHSTTINQTCSSRCLPSTSGRLVNRYALIKPWLCTQAVLEGSTLISSSTLLPNWPSLNTINTSYPRTSILDCKRKKKIGGKLAWNSCLHPITKTWLLRSWWLFQSFSRVSGIKTNTSFSKTSVTFTALMFTLHKEQSSSP